MSWVLLLIQLIPTIIKIVEAIVKWTKKLPTREERSEARKELRGLARAHVAALRATKDAKVYASMAEADAEKDFAEMLERVKARASA